VVFDPAGCEADRQEPGGVASGQPCRSRALEDYMNWDAVSAVGQTVGALAVVISLIYLAIQMR